MTGNSLGLASSKTTTYSYSGRPRQLNRCHVVSRSISGALIMIRLLLALLLVWSSASDVGAGMAAEIPLSTLQEQLVQEFQNYVPHEWGEAVLGVHSRLKTRDKVIALTFDACGGSSGKGFDAALIRFLEQQRIPATLFFNARWIDANPEIFKKLAANPLFEIANHGLLHRPASVSGRSVYGITGTGNVADLVTEIEGNARKIFLLTGNRTHFYRSGTAYYDEVAVQVSRRLGHEVIGFSILGDAGATYRREQVKAALLKAVPGDIALLHMNHPNGETTAGVMDALPELKRRGFNFVKLSDYPLD